MTDYSSNQISPNYLQYKLLQTEQNIRVYRLICSKAKNSSLKLQVSCCFTPRVIHFEDLMLRLRNSLFSEIQLTDHIYKHIFKFERRFFKRQNFSHFKVNI